jgi:hypothetical protein
LQYGVSTLSYRGIIDAAALPLVILLIGVLGFFTTPLLSGFSYIPSNKPEPEWGYATALGKGLLDDHPSYR